MVALRESRMAKECNFSPGIYGGTKGGQREVNKEEFTKK